LSSMMRPIQMFLVDSLTFQSGISNILTRP
jgi:hypothetical protein